MIPRLLRSTFALHPFTTHHLLSRFAPFGRCSRAFSDYSSTDESLWATLRAPLPKQTDPVQSFQDKDLPSLIIDHRTLRASRSFDASPASAFHLLKHLCNTKEYTLAKEHLLDLLRDRMYPPTSLFQQTLSSLYECGDLGGAQALIDEAKKQHYPFTVLSLIPLLGRCASSELFLARLRGLMEHIKARDTSVALAMVKAAIATRIPGLGMKTIHMAHARNFPLSTDCFNLLIDQAGRLDHKFTWMPRAREIKVMMESMGFIANARTYAALLKLSTASASASASVSSSFSRSTSSSSSETESIWTEMCLLGLKPTEAAVEVYLAFLLRSDRRSEAVTLTEEYIRQGVITKSATIQSVLAALSNSGDTAKAAEIIAQMKHAHIPVSLPVYHSLMRGYVQQHDIHRAEGILASLEGEKIEPTTKTFAIVIDGYLTIGNVRRVGEVFRRMDEMGLTPDETVFAAVLHGHIMRRDLQKVDETRSQMRADHITLSMETYSRLLEGYQATAMEDKLEETWTEMDTASILKNHYCYAMMIKHYLQAAAQIEKTEVNARLLNAETKIPEMTIAIVESRDRSAAKRQRALELLSEMEGAGIRPQEGLVRMFLIDAVLRRDQPKIDHWIAYGRERGYRMQKK